MTTLAPGRPGRSTFPVLLVAVWFVGAYLAAAAGWYPTDGSEPPWRFGLAILLPVGGVGLALSLSPSFRAWTASLDLQLMTVLQTWRFAGFVFVVLWSADLLPGGFALPAGLGDIAVALTAPFVARHLAGRGVAAAPLFLAWTAFGILDLVAAVTLGILSSPGPLGLLSGPVNTDLVGTLPLVLIPTFGVPLMLVLHLLSLANFRARTAAAALRADAIGTA